MKIIFAGTPEFAVPSLQALIDSKHEIVAVYTQPDRPAGRGRKLQPSPVKLLAEQSSLEVLQPINFRAADALAEFDRVATDVDVMVVVAYGLILPEAILQAPKYGCVNVHPSRLPQWRGAAPIQHAILHGDKITAVTIIQLEKGMDSGPILHQREYAIAANETSGELHDRLAIEGADCLLHPLDGLVQGDIAPVEQQHELATYTSKISKVQAEIDWESSSQSIVNAIRAYNPWPVAFTQVSEQRLRVWQAHVLQGAAADQAGVVVNYSKQGLDVAGADGVVRITQLQLPGSKALHITDFFNARQDFISLGESLL